jgi:hypothetical protein
MSMERTHSKSSPPWRVPIAIRKGWVKMKKRQKIKVTRQKVRIRWFPSLEGLGVG